MKRTNINTKKLEIDPYLKHKKTDIQKEKERKRDLALRQAQKERKKERAREEKKSFAQAVNWLIKIKEPNR